MILIVAYTLNDLLVSNVEKEGGNAFSCSGIILMTLFGLTTAGNIVWLVFQFIKFGGDGCGTNVAFLTIGTIIAAFSYIIVFFRTRKDASVLTSSIVWSYQLYLSWSAMSSAPDVKCNPYTNSAGNTTAEIILGLFFTFFSLLVVGGSTTRGDDNTVTGEMGSHMMEKEENTQPYTKVDLEGTGDKKQ